MLTHKSFTKVIDDINKGTTERRGQIHEALMFCAYCARADRNADPAIRLFAVVGRETNRQNMAQWLSQNAPIGFKDGVPFFHEKKAKLYDDQSLVEFEASIQNATKWYMLKNETSEVKDTLDILELIRNAVKKGENAVKKGEKKIEHAELLAEVAALLNNKQYAG